MPKPFNPKDKYFHKAKEQGYKARSAFKLEEIQQKFKILRPGDMVLDLGAAPGSFLQYASKIIGIQGKALGLDLQEIEVKLPNVRTKVCDIYDTAKVDGLIKGFLDVILSDLAPKTTGQKDVDQWHSIELNRQVLQIAERHLKLHGNCLMKVFQGEDFDEFYREVKLQFGTVKIAKPKAVRDRSFEVYLVCLGHMSKANVHINKG